MKIECLSEFSYLIRFPGDKSSLPEPTQLGIAAELIRETFGEQWIEVVPVFADLLVTLSPQAFLNKNDPQERISSCLKKLQGRGGAQIEPRRIEVPVCYDEEFAEDLPELAQKGGVSVVEAIKLHSEQDYRVYAMGFCAGFAYMGDVAGPLRQPRRSSPRTKMPKGCVAVADFMTCVYPLAMPGGWHIIGRCPIPFFIPEDQVNPTLVKGGDVVRFHRVDRNEYNDLKEKWQN